LIKYLLPYNNKCWSTTIHEKNVNVGCGIMNVGESKTMTIDSGLKTEGKQRKCERWEIEEFHM
jgi:hypothetical protein